MQARPRILIVEDEEAIRQGLIDVVRVGRRPQVANDRLEPILDAWDYDVDQSVEPSVLFQLHR